MLAVALVMGLMSSLTAITMSMVPLAGVPHVIIVEFWSAPTIFTESLMFKVPVVASYAGLAARGSVSVYVPTSREMVSVPGVALALRTASRRLQEEEVSTLLTLLQASVIGEVGVGSSKRLGKNVGSGIGITIEGAVWP